MADGRIIIDTEIDNSGAEEGLKKTVSSAKSQAAKLAAEYKKQGMSSSEAFKKAWSEIERDSDEKSKKTADNWKNNLSGKLGSIAKTGLAAITGLIAGATAALGGLGTIGLKFNSDMENYLTNFDVMLGSAESATKHVADLKEFAAKTPFEMSNLANASKLLLQFGADVDDIMPNLQMLGDISLGNGEKFQSLALVFAQVQSQGKLMGQDLLQMINAGFNPLQVISQQTGESMASLKEKMSDGQISFEMVAEAMKVATSEGGRFYQGMEKQSKTMTGLISTLKDNATSLIGNVFQPVSDSIKNDILPAALGYVDELQKAFESDGITGVVSKFGQIGGEIISQLANSLPGIVNMGVNIIQSLITGIKNNLPTIATGAIDIVMSLVNGIIEILPMLLEVGLQALISIGQGIAANLPTLIPTIVNLIISMCDMIIENLPLIIDVAIDIILALVQGLVNALPILISEVPRIINSFADAIYNTLPQILKAGIDILLILIKGLIQSIPTLIANIPQIIMAIVNVITLYNWASLGKSVINWLSNGISSMKGNIGNIARGVAEWVGTSIKNIFSGGLSWGKGLISSIGQGFSSMISYLGSSARSVATGALNAIKSAFAGGADIGKNLIQGIWNGISNMKQWILDKIGGFAGSVISGIKSFFGIHSPSRVMRDLIGVNLVKGIGVGVDVETPNLEKDINDNMADLTAKMKGTVDYETARTSTVVAAKNTYKESSSADNPGTNGIPEGSIFILKNDIDGKSLGETVYKVVDGKLAIASRRKRG